MATAAVPSILGILRCVDHAGSLHITSDAVFVCFGASFRSPLPTTPTSDFTKQMSWIAFRAMLSHTLPARTVIQTSMAYTSLQTSFMDASCYSICFRCEHTSCSLHTNSGFACACEWLGQKMQVLVMHKKRATTRALTLASSDACFTQDAF